MKVNDVLTFSKVILVIFIGFILKNNSIFAQGLNNTDSNVIEVRPKNNEQCQACIILQPDTMILPNTTLHPCIIYVYVSAAYNEYNEIEVIADSNKDFGLIPFIDATLSHVTNGNSFDLLDQGTLTLARAENKLIDLQQYEIVEGNYILSLLTYNRQGVRFNLFIPSAP